MAPSRPLAHPDLDIVEIDGESVVFARQQDHLYFLNHPATIVLGLCDGTSTRREMAEAIAEVYEMPVDTVESDVRGVLRELRALELLAPAGTSAASPPEPAAADDLDERERIRLDVPRST